MSLYIWEITISGGYKYTPEAMLKFLSENGIKPGIKKKCQRKQDRGAYQAELQRYRLGFSRD